MEDYKNEFKITKKPEKNENDKKDEEKIKKPVKIEPKEDQDKKGSN